MTQAEPPINKPTYVPYRADLESPGARRAAADREDHRLAPQEQREGVQEVQARASATRTPRATEFCAANSRCFPICPSTWRRASSRARQTYPIIVSRLSTTAGAIRSDQVRGVRGLGIKVLGVPGNAAAQGRHRDQPRISSSSTSPEFPFKDALDYSKGGMRLARALSCVPDIGMQGDQSVLQGREEAPEARSASNSRWKARCSPATTHTPWARPFYTAAPLQYGKYVAKLSVAPLSPSVVALKTVVVEKDSERAHRSRRGLLQEQQRRVRGVARSCAPTMRTGCRSRTPACSGRRTNRRT